MNRHLAPIFYRNHANGSKPCRGAERCISASPVPSRRKAADAAKTRHARRSLRHLNAPLIFAGSCTATLHADSVQRLRAQVQRLHLRAKLGRPRSRSNVVYPHLIVKPRQARIAIYLQSLLRVGGLARTDRDVMRRLWEANKACNSFGDPDIDWVPQPDLGRWVPEKYFYDADAVRERQPSADPSHPAYRPSVMTPEGAAMTAGNWKSGVDTQPQRLSVQRKTLDPRGRNLRSVWSIPTEPTPEAHFATFPQALVEPCVKAGTSEYGCCEACGAPWCRETSRDDDGVLNVVLTGWNPSCTCNAAVTPCTVLDPFAGSGTTCLVARRLGRHSIGIDLSAEYLGIARKRIGQPTLWSNPA